MQLGVGWVSLQTLAARISQHGCLCQWFLPLHRRPPWPLLFCRSPPNHFLCVSCPSLLWNGIKGSNSLILRLSFPFLILQACLGSSKWCRASTHRTASCSHCQLLPFFLSDRITTGKCYRIVSFFFCSVFFFSKKAKEYDRNYIGIWIFFENLWSCYTIFIAMTMSFPSTYHNDYRAMLKLKNKIII